MPQVLPCCMQEKPNIKDSKAGRLHAALDLMQFGIEIMRQNIIRKMPAATQETVNSLLQKWIEKQDSCNHTVNSNTGNSNTRNSN